MPNTKLTREKLKNHFDYSKMIYVLIAVLMGFTADLAYTTTEYRPPKDRKVEIQIVGEYSDPEVLSEVAAQALLDGQAFDANLEAVEFFALTYSGLEDDVYGAQKYMVMLGAQEGHIYILNRGLMEQLVLQGAAVPLDDYIASGVLNPGDADLSKLTYAEPVEDENTPPTGVSHVYALPATGLGKVLDLGVGYDIRDKYFVIMAFAPNPDTTAHVLGSLMDQLAGPLPEWMTTDDQA